MKYRDIIIAILAVLFVALVLFQGMQPAEPKQAPNIGFKIIDGRTLTLAALRGQPVLVTFWSTTCPSCIKEIPHLMDLYKEFSPQGFEIIAVAMPYDRPDFVLALAKKRDIPYPIALDIQSEAVRAFGNVNNTPTSFLIAPDGRIVKHEVGVMDFVQLRRSIMGMLQSRIST